MTSQIQSPNPNKPIRLDGSDDYNFVSNSSYPFTLDIETLINNSKKSRRQVKYLKKGGKAPRPQNAWVIYRKDVNERFNKLSKNQGEKSSERSKKIGSMWRCESKENKEIFEALARLAERRHAQVYGEDYKYNPNKSSKKEKNSSTQSSPMMSSSTEFESDDFDEVDDVENPQTELDYKRQMYLDSCIFPETMTMTHTYQPYQELPNCDDMLQAQIQTQTQLPLSLTVECELDWGLDDPNISLGFF